MSESELRDLVANIESQIAASGPRDRERLRIHLDALRQKAAMSGMRRYHPGSRAEQDRIDDAVEAQFDNLPV